MDGDLSDQIENLAFRCLNSPVFNHLTERERILTFCQLKDRFYVTVLDALLVQLSEDQIRRLQSLPYESDEMDSKVNEIIFQMPFLAVNIELRLNKEFEFILKNGVIPSLINLYPQM